METGSSVAAEIKILSPASMLAPLTLVPKTHFLAMVRVRRIHRAFKTHSLAAPPDLQRHLEVAIHSLAIRQAAKIRAVKRMRSLAPWPVLLIRQARETLSLERKRVEEIKRVKITRILVSWPVTKTKGMPTRTSVHLLELAKMVPTTLSLDTPRVPEM